MKATSLLFFTALINNICIANAISEDFVPVELDSVMVTPEAIAPPESHRVIVSPQDYAYEDIGNILDRQTGLQTQDTGGFGTYSSFWLRGSTAKSVAVYLDGIKINDPLNGGVNLSTLPLWSLQTIDIYKSTVPAHLINASGTGALNLNTQSIQQKQELKINTGSFGNQSIGTNVANENFLLSAEWFKADNDFPYLHDNQTKENQSDDYNTKRLNNQVDRQFILVKGQQELLAAKVDLMAIQRSYDTGISNNLNQAKNAYLRQNSKMISARVKSEYWQAIISADIADHLYDDSVGVGEIGLGADSQYIKYEKKEAKVINTVNASNFKSIFAIQTSQEKTSVEGIINNTESHLKIKTNYASLAHSLKVNEDLTISNTWLLRDNSGDNIETFNSDIAYNILDIEHINLQVSLARKSRLPSISELYLNQGNQVGNPELTPEFFNEVNIRSQFQLNNIGGTLEFYTRDSEDTIVYSYDARGIGQASNEGQSKITGMESQLYWHLDEVDLNWSIEYIDSINKSSSKAFKGNHLPSFFHATHYISLTYWLTNTRIQAEHQYKAGLYYDTANLEKAPNQNIWNLSADYHQPYWHAGLKLNNVFNSFYTGFKTEPLPGRSILFSLTITQ